MIQFVMVVLVIAGSLMVLMVVTPSKTISRRREAASPSFVCVNELNQVGLRSLSTRRVIRVAGKTGPRDAELAAAGLSALGASQLLAAQAPAWTRPGPPAGRVNFYPIMSASSLCSLCWPRMAGGAVRSGPARPGGAAAGVDRELMMRAGPVRYRVASRLVAVKLATRWLTPGPRVTMSP